LVRPWPHYLYCRSINVVAWVPYLCMRLCAAFVNVAQLGVYCLGNHSITAALALTPIQVLFFRVFRLNTSRLSHSTRLDQAAPSHTIGHSTHRTDNESVISQAQSREAVTQVEGLGEQITQSVQRRAALAQTIELVNLPL
jgi:hypothetical protein